MKTGVTRFGRTRKIHLKRWVTGSVSQQGKVAYIFNIQKNETSFFHTNRSSSHSRKLEFFPSTKRSCITSICNQVVTRHSNLTWITSSSSSMTKKYRHIFPHHPTINPNRKLKKRRGTVHPLQFYRPKLRADGWLGAVAKKYYTIFIYWYLSEHLQKYLC